MFILMFILMLILMLILILILMLILMYAYNMAKLIIPLLHISCYVLWFVCPCFAVLCLYITQ